MRRFVHFVLAAVTLSVASACHETPAVRDDADMAEARSDLLPAVDTSQFVGEWIFRAGATLNDSCLGQQPQPAAELMGQFFAVEAKNGILTVALDAPLACSLDFQAVAPNVALLVSGQTCRDAAGVVLTAYQGSMTSYDLEGALIVQLAGPHCSGGLHAPTVEHVIGPP